MEKFHPGVSFNKASILLCNTNYFERIDHGLHSSQNILRTTHDFDRFKYINEITKKPYFIYDITSFYKYYPNFDTVFYRNTYFKNSEISEIDMLAFYHTQGFHMGHKTNPKRRILFYIPEFDENCGGIVALFNMCNFINKNSTKFYAEIVNTENNRTQNPVCNSYANYFGDVDSIAVYPETVNGNPLGLKNVVRWILLDLGTEMPYNKNELFGPNDLIYEWIHSSTRILGKELRKVYVNPTYKHTNKEPRTKTCSILKKGPFFHKNIQTIHPPNCLDIESLKAIDSKILNMVFNACSHFYCYDPKTMYIMYAMICGCVPIVYPLENVNKQEYAKRFMLGITRGYAYGLEDVEYAQETLQQGVLDIFKTLEKDDETIYSFLEDLTTMCT